ncbi:MAG: Fis family transcriptional regulator [Actinomycetia bacterium]|jgi:DNA-binding NtrC family response regulator|nr:Fis family transcriptional regulator [Actinomycetes bacterium]
MTSWIRFVTSEASTAASSVRSALADVVWAPPPPAPDGSDIGLIVFDRVSKDVLDLVRGSSRGGVRILAVGTSPEAVDDIGPWPLLDAGASDVVVRTDDASLADGVSARLSRWAEVEELVHSPEVQDALAGRTLAWTSLLREIVEVARFSDASVLLIGESGTGKDVVARLIHELDPRPFKDEFVPIDCRTFVGTHDREDLAGHLVGTSEEADAPLFGDIGLESLGVRDAGTIFLDEVGSLPSSLRGSLLRNIEHRNRRPVGGTGTPMSNLRLICSTSEEPSGPGSETADDFWERITTRFRLPPLRERRDDIPTIAEHLLRRLRPNGEEIGLDPALGAFLESRDYPANVHDLLTLIRGISARHAGPGVVTVGSIPRDERFDLGTIDHSWQRHDLERAVRLALDAGASLKTIGEAARDAAVRIALSYEGGDVARAAKRLRATTRTIASRTGVDQTEADTDRTTSEPPSIVEVPETALLGAGDPAKEPVPEP